MSARSSRSIATLARSFSTSTNVSAGAAAAPSEAIQAQRRKGERPIGVKHAMTLKPFEFNDIPWLGWLKMFKMRQALELGEKVRDHEAALRAQYRPFTPPPQGAIRITQTVELSQEKSIKGRRVVLHAPISALPLNGSEAIHRCKVIAGTHFTPGKPGTEQLDYDTRSNNGEGKDGWITIGEDRFQEMRMNRKSASDMLDRLIEAANDPKSPIAADTPVDLRHLIARRRRKKDGLTFAQYRAQTQRSGTTKGSLGFPAEWLGEDVKQKALEGRA